MADADDVDDDDVLMHLVDDAELSRQRRRRSRATAGVRAGSLHHLALRNNVSGSDVAQQRSRLRGAVTAAYHRSSNHGRPADMEHTHRVARLLVRRDVDAPTAMPQTRQGQQAGYVDMRPLVPADFHPTIELPEADYWLDDVDLGGDLLNVTPEEAARVIEGAGRSGLTLEEGVAVLLAHPGILRAANGYQMLASSAGDRRVPSLWVTREGRPRLGWCWSGNPHSWLGAASCASRTPVDQARSRVTR